MQGFSLINVNSWTCSSKLTQCHGKTKILIQNYSFTDNHYKSALVNMTHEGDVANIAKYSKATSLLLYVHIHVCLFQKDAKYFLSFHSYNFLQKLLIEKNSISVIIPYAQNPGFG